MGNHFDEDEIDPLWEARRREMARQNRFGCLPELAGCALFLVLLWAVLGVDGALSGDTDMLTNSFRAAMRAVFGR